jgi:uncharacterized protein
MEPPMPEKTAQLTEEERAELLRIARRTLEEYLATKRKPAIEVASARLREERRGAFVTLHHGAKLRGCIGTFEAEEAICDTVQRMAVASATSDPRFPSVKADELGELRIEISVLSPLTVATAEEVRVSEHGIYITRGYHRGVLLPQVATENGWDRETFLAHTCLKAGLDPDDWRDPKTQIEVFSADVFGEPERG